MVECFCNHLTSFAGGWVVAPNTIDFSSLDFDPTKNPTIYITLSVIAGKHLSIALVINNTSKCKNFFYILYHLSRPWTIMFSRQ